MNDTGSIAEEELTKRQLAAALLVVSLVLPAAAWAAAPAVVGGKVFLDANNDGVPDPGEKGFSGIRVTDGRGFAVTSKDGAYSLKIAHDYKGRVFPIAFRSHQPVRERVLRVGIKNGQNVTMSPSSSRPLAR